MPDAARDIIAGLATAALSIPISMGYAQVAGLPPVYGLYASIVTPIAYSLVSRSGDIVFGMDSATSAATGGAVAAVGIAAGSLDSQSFIPLLTICVAAFLMLFSVLRVGGLAQFVPTPVMHGFIVGVSASVIIGQIPSLTGGTAATGTNIVSTLQAAASSIAGSNPVSACLGVIALIVILLCARAVPKIPATLITLAFATAFAAFIHIDAWGVAILGSMPTGRPFADFSNVSAVQLLQAASYGLAVAAVSASESLLTVDLFAMKKGRNADGNRELLAFGVANAASALCGCAPCSASLSRTAAGEEAGGRTRIMPIASAATVALAVFLLGPYLYYLPQPVLGAVVIAAMAEVVDAKKIIRYLKHLHVEFAVFAATAVCVMAMGAVPGVLVGVALSFATLLYRRHSRRHREFLGVVSPDAATVVGRMPADTVVYELEGILSFANIGAVSQDFLEKVAKGPHIAIVDISGITELDTTATDRILQLIDTARKRHIDVRLVRSIERAQDRYTGFELRTILAKTAAYPSIEAALEQVPRDVESVVERPGVSGSSVR
jgi:SulP family sulfate permease